MTRTHKRKHVPQRTCISCRQTAGKRSLTRIVRTREGIRLDVTGKVAGRGAYLCDRLECWQRAAKTNLLDRALKTRLTAEERAMLQAEADRRRVEIPNPTT